MEDSIFKNIRNLFKSKKRKQNYYRENNQERLGDITNLFEQYKEACYKPVRVGNFWSNNYIEYETNFSKNRKQSI